MGHNGPRAIMGPNGGSDGVQKGLGSWDPRMRTLIRGQIGGSGVDLDPIQPGYPGLGPFWDPIPEAIMGMASPLTPSWRSPSAPPLYTGGYGAMGIIPLAPSLRGAKWGPKWGLRWGPLRRDPGEESSYRPIWTRSRGPSWEGSQKDPKRGPDGVQKGSRWPRHHQDGP